MGRAETKRIVKGLVVVGLVFLMIIGFSLSGVASDAYSESNFTFSETAFDTALTPEEQETIQTMERDQELIRAFEQKITTDQNKLSGTELLPESFTPIRDCEPKWYSYITVSGSLRYGESIWYGRYSGMDSLIIQVNWVPTPLSLTAVILDVTEGTSTQYRWVGGLGSVICNVNPSHAYLVGFMNCAGAGTTITLNGTLTLVLH
ncbi:MAG: hypothetical protein NUV70_08715 [Caldiserica bacterium]|jgi:hypothetical protein|nr:hypothetical protein [Caldisericota bacterium]